MYSKNISACVASLACVLLGSTIACNKSSDEPPPLPSAAPPAAATQAQPQAATQPAVTATGTTEAPAGSAVAGEHERGHREFEHKGGGEHEHEHRPPQ